jgi:hypothetical protein
MTFRAIKAYKASALAAAPLRRSAAGLLRICTWPAGSAQTICAAHHDSAWHHATIKALRLQSPSAQARCRPAAHPRVQLAGVRRRSARHITQRAPQVTIKQRAWAPPLCTGPLRVCCASTHVQLGQRSEAVSAQVLVGCGEARYGAGVCWWGCAAVALRCWCGCSEVLG